MVTRNTAQYVIHRYPKEHYLTLFDRESGFFARVENKGFSEPFWSPAGPELMDISITNWCDRSCSICYKNSNCNGKHMNLEDYEKIMVQAQNMNVLQVALGGGNPNQHPDFVNILRLTREKYGIVPSYTTNGRGLDNNILEASKKYCGAVAVSAYEPYDEANFAIELLGKSGIRTNIHFVLTSKSIDLAVKWLIKPPSLLEKINAIIFLSYKPVGKFKDQKLLLCNSDMLNQFFDLATKVKHKFKIGFDSCLVPKLAKYTTVDRKLFDFCDAGRFSLYISENLEIFPCSFMVEKFGGISLKEKSILDIWRHSKLFNDMRNRCYKTNCSTCSVFDACKGGCAIFPEINICD